MKSCSNKGALAREQRAKKWRIEQERRRSSDESGEFEILRENLRCWEDSEK